MLGQLAEQSQTPGGARLPRRAAEELSHSPEQVHGLLEQTGLLGLDPVLELGCSSGLYTLILALEGRTVVGLDPDPDCLAVARLLAGNCPQPAAPSFLRGAAEAIPFPPGHFQAVIQRRWRPGPEPGAALGEINRVLAPGGRLLLGCADLGRFLGSLFNEGLLGDDPDRLRFAYGVLADSLLFQAGIGRPGSCIYLAAPGLQQLLGSRGFRIEAEVQDGRQAPDFLGAGTGKTWLAVKVAESQGGFSDAVLTAGDQEAKQAADRLIELGNPSLALGLLEPLDSDGDPQVRSLRCRALLKMGRAEQARELCPEPEAGLAAMIAHGCGELAEARDLYGRALAGGAPNRAQLSYLMARCLLEEGRSDEAGRIFGQILAADPLNLQGWLGQVGCALEDLDTERAWDLAAELLLRLEQASPGPVGEQARDLLGRFEDHPQGLAGLSRARERLQAGSQRKTIHLHIGSDKTASSLFQRLLLSINQSELAPRGYAYDHELSAEVGRKIRERMPLDAAATADLREHYRERYQKSPARNFILASNVFFGHRDQGFSDAEELAELAGRVFADFDLRIYAFVRRQDTFLESSYIQTIKTGRDWAFAEFLEQVSAWESCDWHRIIGYYARVLGAERITVLPYELMQEDPDRFYRLLFAAFGLDYAPDASGLPVVNPGIDQTGIQILRACNSFLDDRQRRLLREFLETNFQRGGTSMELFSSEERQRLLRAYAPGNHRLFETYMPELPELDYSRGLL